MRCLLSKWRSSLLGCSSGVKYKVTYQDGFPYKEVNISSTICGSVEKADIIIHYGNHGSWQCVYQQQQSSVS